MHIQFQLAQQCIQISTRINSSSVHTYIFVCFTLRVILQGFVTQNATPSCSAVLSMATPPSVDGGEHPEAVLSSAVPPSDSTPNSSAVLSMVTPPSDDGGSDSGSV